MYRLLGFQSVTNARLLLNHRKLVESQQSFSLLFNSKSSLLKPKCGGFCLPCYSSNGISPEILKILTKKKRRKYKKYTELLQVTESSTKQTTTSIQKLKAKKLSNFISSGGIDSKNFATSSLGKRELEYNKYSVDMLEVQRDANDPPMVFIGTNVRDLKLSKDGMQEIIDSYNAFKDISENPEEELAGVVEEEIIEEEEVLPEVSVEKSVKEKKNKGKFSGKFHKSLELENLSKQKSLAVSLSAYLDCCVQNGMLNRGYLTIMNYRYKYLRQNGIKLTDVNLYNTLIHGYAEKENLAKCRELLNILTEDHITPNQQTFANFLECLGRIQANPTAMRKNHVEGEEKLKDLVAGALKQAEELKISVNDIIDKSIFVRDQREVVLNVIRLAVPDFEPVYSPPTLTYDNKILNDLNENVRHISENPLENLGKSQLGSEIMDSKTGFTRETLETLTHEQLSSELGGYITIKSIQKFPPPTAAVLHARSKVEELQKSWHDVIVYSFHRDLNTLRFHESAKSRGNQNLLPYLRALEVDDYADIVIRETRNLAEGSETYSPTINQLYKSLGQKVELRYHTESKKRSGVLQKTGEIYGNFCDILAAGGLSDNPRQCWQRLVHLKANEGPTMRSIEKSWPLAAQVAVGRFLYNILMRDLKIDVNCLKTTKLNSSENRTPAFYTLFRNQGRLVKEEVKPHPLLVKLYRSSQQENLTFEVNQVPMVCPPQPWTTCHNGGYLLAKSDLIRLPLSARQQMEEIEKTELTHLYPSLDSLNQLAGVAWRVNQDVLDVILKVFNDGGDEKLDVPQPPQSLRPLETPADPSALSKTEKYEIFRQKMQHRRKQAEMYSLWCDALYRLSLANHYRDRVFWLPHNMDFRGRVYPLPPHLNHLGSDLARCLLVFHKKKKLGVDGFAWLKLHCINLTGLKKRDSVRERLLYAEAIMDDILDSADNPLTGRRWWTKSDEPWQTLSCCMEIAKVLRSGDPENFESSFPIHQDGSCNGLQHYAALGRDSAGAFSVNLAPADRPQDVYSGVAQLVENARQRDEENGLEVARVLRNFVRRKVIKQTVMTTVYGVTRYGARLQIAKQLKDIDDFPKEFVWSASNYLTNKTFESLREMFTSTKEIQDWFTDCARLISSTCGQNVEWVTPLGLPVVQPYSRTEKFKNNAKLDGNVAIDTFAKPNIMKQKNAFPPNFIHSLDSSHMMLTSLHCEKAGLTFISVHDCFWTHACTVPEMNKICREQFVALHSEPILESLSKYMIQKYSFHQKDFHHDGSVSDMAKRKLNRILTMVPEKGDFELKNVLESVYFFS